MSGLICKMADQKEDLKGHKLCPVNKEKLFPALDLRPLFTSKKLLMRSKLQNPNHLLLMNNALSMNTNVICVIQVMWATPILEH